MFGWFLFVLWFLRLPVPLPIVPSAPTTISITVNFMVYRLSSSLAKSRNSSFFSPSFNFTLWSAGKAKSTIRQFLFFFQLSRSGRLAVIRWSVCISKSKRTLWVSFSRMDSWLCIYYLLTWWNFSFLHILKGSISLPTPCLILHSLRANLLHSFIIIIIIIIIRPPITIAIKVTFLFHSVFNSLARSRYLTIFSLSLNVSSVVSRDNTVHNFASSLFFCWSL